MFPRYRVGSIESTVHRTGFAIIEKHARFVTTIEDDVEIREELFKLWSVSKVAKDVRCESTLCMCLVQSASKYVVSQLVKLKAPSRISAVFTPAPIS